jgi:hypothetical protein
VKEAPRTFTELRSLLFGLEPDRDFSALVHLVRTQLPLVQVLPGGTWDIGGSPSLALAAPNESLRALVLRYLAAFKPTRKGHSDLGGIGPAEEPYCRA